MNEKEIRAMFVPRKCETQVEFERIMTEMNNVRSKLNYPSLDRERELVKQNQLLSQQKQAINIQQNSINLERLDLVQKRKDINRVFHDLKHQFVMLNPRTSGTPVNELIEFE